LMLGEAGAKAAPPETAGTPSGAAPAPQPATGDERAVPRQSPPPGARRKRAVRFPFAPRAALPRSRSRLVLPAFVTAALLLGVLTVAKRMYDALWAPVDAMEFITREALRVAGQRRPVPDPSLEGFATWAAMERLSGAWSRVSRQMTSYISRPGEPPAAPQPPEPEAAKEVPGLRSRAPPGEPGLRVPSGTDMVPLRGRRGSGTVRVVNETALDALAEMVSRSAPETVLRLVYVRANGEATISQIPTGVYLVKFRLGLGWSARAGAFSRDRERSGPVGPLEFFEIQAPEGSRSDRYEIRLKPAAIGSAASSPR